MGISGLLPMLKEIQENDHISNFKGKRLAVDAYVWLHKGAFGCAEAIVKGQKTTKFVDYAMHRVRLLRHFGITPYIVFDGGPLPAKKGTEVSRAKSRADHLAKAQSLESQGRLKEARECYTKCLDITPEMAYQLIKALRAENVDYVVAPYEADAQLCFLEREGYVDGIITEDSDLLVFGCQQILFKLDGNGQCISINRDRLATISEFPMHGWSDLHFRRMAMLSGCDYLPSISGIGIKTAHRMLRRFKTVEKILQSLRLEGNHVIPPNYPADFAQAELAFIHQRVFDPALKKLVPLCDFPEEGLQSEDEKWIGLDMEEATAHGIASGDLHPETGLPIEDQWPDYKPGSRPVVTRAISSPTRRFLRDTSKPNVTNVVAGPMDAFVSRTKRASEPLPKKLGVMTSGPSTLSEQRMFQRQTSRNEEAERTPAAVNKSKFFSGRKQTARQQLDEAARMEAEKMVWEHSDEEGPEVESQSQGGPSKRPQSSPDHFQSPSPPIRSPKDSPQAKLEIDTYVFTSPAEPRLSSPVSSPVNELADSYDVFSPPPRVKRQKLSPTISPSKPPRTHSEPFLVAPSSQMAPGSSSQPCPGTQDGLGVSSSKTPARTMFRLSSVLVPDSSPFAPTTSKVDRPSPSGSSTPLDLRRLCGKRDLSSDSIDEDEIVTPSLETTKRKGSRGKGDKGRDRSENEGPVVVEDEVDEASRARAEQAKTVAKGWQLKFGFKEHAFPPPGSTRIKRDTPRPPASFPHLTTMRPTAGAGAAAKSVLTPKPVNVIKSSKMAEAESPFAATNASRKYTPEVVTKRSASKSPEKRSAPAPSPLSSHMPAGPSSLSRFRFAGKLPLVPQQPF